MSKTTTQILGALDREPGFVGTLCYCFPHGVTSKLHGNTIMFELHREKSGKLIAHFSSGKDPFRHILTDSGVIEPVLFKIVQRKLREFGIEMQGLQRQSQRSFGRLLTPTEIGRSP